MIDPEVVVVWSVDGDSPDIVPDPKKSAKGSSAIAGSIAQQG